MGVKMSELAQILDKPICTIILLELIPIFFRLKEYPWTEAYLNWYSLKIGVPSKSFFPAKQLVFEAILSMEYSVALSQYFYLHHSITR